jgi:hypothetical protein
VEEILVADRTALLRGALSHAARGWHVFPLWPGSKAPAVEDAWERRATTDPSTIRARWSRRPYNIGIATGPSGLVVIDLDAPKPSGVRPATAATSATPQVSGWTADPASDGTTATAATTGRHGREVFARLCTTRGELIPSATYTVATAGGGWHLYYRHPAGETSLRNTKGGSDRSLGELIDTRAHGGYVVGAGSMLDQHAYRVVVDAEVAALPNWLADLLTELDTAPRPAAARARMPLSASGRRSAYLRAAVDCELGHVIAAPRGKGNAVLWGAAVALGQLVAGGELDVTLVTDMLEQAAMARGRTMSEARATIASGLKRGAQRPRTVA